MHCYPGLPALAHQMPHEPLRSANAYHADLATPVAAPLALSLLDQLLAFNPDNRITVEAALAHPYLVCAWVVWRRRRVGLVTTAKHARVGVGLTWD